MIIVSRIAEAFEATRANDELALIGYLTAGYPSPAETVGLLEAAVRGGADVIEFGVPFSDPMGDGPVIQHCGQVALRAGMTTAKVLGQVSAARTAGITVPIALMGYCNPFVRYGVKRLFEDAASAGVDALIVPDLPPNAEQFTPEWLAQSEATGVNLVFFAAPASDTERLRIAGSATTGFLYCLATDGVTGARDTLDPRLLSYLARLREATTAPLAVGFGISRAEHVASLRGHADGVIVGSALLREIGAAPDASARREAATRFLAGLKAAAR
jgi:tryptophan synthase alpha chain